jgi:hypothetical protein
MKLIENIYAYIETKNSEKVKEYIFSALEGNESEGGVWERRVLKNSPNYYLKHASEQLKNEGVITLIPENDKLSIFVAKNSTSEKTDIEIASLFLGRFVTALLYHCPSIKTITIKR